jgi:hypothetical protein
MVDTMAACTHSQVHAIFMRWPVPPSTPPRPHHTETIAARAPSPVDPRIGRTHPADAPNTNTQDRQSTPWLYSPLDRRAELKAQAVIDLDSLTPLFEEALFQERLAEVTLVDGLVAPV